MCSCSAKVAVEIRLCTGSLQVTSLSTGVACAVCEAILPCPATEVVVRGLVSIAATSFVGVTLIVTSGFSTIYARSIWSCRCGEGLSTAETDAMLRASLCRPPVPMISQ